jgi:hypothetical protein
MLALITSIRHPRNCTSYSRVSELLEMTLRSIHAQTDDRYVVIIVCNEVPVCQADGRVHFVSVNFPAPSARRRANTGMPAIRIDRGAKYLVGLIYAKRFDPEYVMFFDADDLLSRRLVRFVLTQPGAHNWYLDQGYEYQLGADSIRLRNDFHKHCGTSHIYRNDVFDVPEGLNVESGLDRIVDSVDRRYLLNVLGSHRTVIRRHQRNGHEFRPIPFPAAVWVLGTGENHSGRSAAAGRTQLSEDMIEEFQIPIGLFRSPA